ncbi:MAG: hypothetical protein H7319_20530 [Spirosoma sp.]|nr:hypothetical protein [Spirosoma sp.]
MMQTFFAYINAINLVVWTSLLILFVYKLRGLYRQVNSTYDAYWFDPRWYREPLTHLVLLWGRSQVMETKNVVGDTWLIREVRIKNAVFWTRLRVLSYHNQ